MNNRRMGSCFAPLVILAAVVCGPENVVEARDETHQDPLLADLIEQFDVNRNTFGIVGLRIPVTFHGRRCEFLLDTGCVDCAVDKSLRSELQASQDRDRIDDLGEWEFVRLDDAYVGRSRMPLRGEALSLDLRPHRIHGILGMSFLEHYVVQIDFVAGKVLFLRSLPPGTWDITIKYDAVDDEKPTRPRWKFDAGHRQEVPFIVDTGMCVERAFEFETEIFDELLKVGRIGNVYQDETMSIAGPEHGREGVIDQFGGPDLPRKSVLVGEHGLGRTNNLLGLAFLRGMVVAFDFPRKTIHVRKGTRLEYLKSPSGSEQDRAQARFARASRAQLDDWMAGPSHGDSIRAAWENVRRTFYTPAWSTKPVADQVAMEPFLDIVETRLRCRPPEVWRDVLWDATNRNGITIPEEAFYRPSSFYRPTKAGISVHPEVELASEDHSISVTADGQTCALLESIVTRERDNDAWKLSLAVGKGRCFAAFHTNDCSPFHLYCMDQRTGAVLWRTEIRGHGAFERYAKKDDIHAVWLRLADGKLYAFGIGSRTAYIEGFAIEDGSNVFRFSTAF